MKPSPVLRRAAALAIAASILGLGIGPALAQGGTDSIEIEASTVGWDHVSPPPEGFFSTADWCFRFPPGIPEGTLVLVDVISPSGETLVGEGVVDADGGVKVLVGITEGGTYTVVGVGLSDGRDVAYVPAELELNVLFDPEQLDCLASLPPQAAPAPTPTPTPTATPVPEPEVEEDEPQPQPEPEEEAVEEQPEDEPADEPADEPEPDDGDDDDDSNLPWILVGIGGVIITGGGLFLLAKKPGKPCDEEKRAWDAAERSFQDALDGVEEAEKTLADAVAARKKAAGELAKAKRDVPPEPGGDSVTDERTGETITSRDRWLRDRYAAAEWDAYQSNPNSETARAYEEAMRSADTPEAREARREAGETARGRAQQLEAALDKTRQTEREAESALGRRQRDVKSEREFADAAKKRYEECIQQQVEFDRKAAEGRKRYEDAVERDRKRRSGGGEGGAGGGGPAITTPPPVEISGPCEPIGSTDTATTRVQGPAIGDNDTVTITITRSHGTWENDELSAGSDDPFLKLFGPGHGAGDRTATFTTPAQRVASLQPAELIGAFNQRQQQLQDDFDATASRRLTVTFSWHQQQVDATCTKQVRCTGSGWLSTGPGTFNNASRPAPDSAPVAIEFGDNNPSAELARLKQTIQKLIDKRDELFDLMEACARP